MHLKRVFSTFGITQAGGAGKVLAEWVIEGETEWDMWAVDPRRYTSYADGKYCVEKAVEIYGHEYAMHFPNYEWPNGRNKKLSPIDDRIKGLGGVKWVHIMDGREQIGLQILVMIRL